MKTKNCWTWLITLGALTVLAACGSGDGTGGDEVPAVSGRVEHGLRVLTIAASTQDQHFRIYRGDYVLPELSDGGPFVLEIPDLEVSMPFPVPQGERPYFKVPNPGVYAFQARDATGTIEAIEYAAAAYREVSSREGAGFIEAREPLVLDVRTAREFAQGHLSGARLIPVQELQARLGELAGYKDKPVFVYCKTGNRSTVAAKVLIDAGHTEVVNLRRGIREWQTAGLAVVR